jgi:hypothetical protein
MNNHFYKIVILLLILNSLNFLHAQNLPEETTTLPETEKTSDFGLAIGIKANTMGIGGEVVAQVLPKLHLRLSTTHYRYNLDMKPYEDFVKGNGFAKVGGVGLAANWHLGRIFFLSAGAFYNMTEIKVSGISSKSVYVGSIEVQPEDVGLVDLSVKPGVKISPYAGLGIGRVISKDHVVSFAFELGASWIDAPKADLKTTGMLEPTSSPEQVKQLNDNLSWINLYPIVSFQLSFRII